VSCAVPVRSAQQHEPAAGLYPRAGLGSAMGVTGSTQGTTAVVEVALSTAPAAQERYRFS
jgi:hypothetical protein